jgi:hypothetical protein
MSTLSTQGGKLLLRQDKLGTQQECCCGPCSCRCAPGDSFLSPTCELQKIIVDFDASLLGPCTGNYTVEVTADDQDKGFPFSKIELVETPGGALVFSVDLFCENNCLVLFIEVYPGSENDCFFCGPDSDFQFQRTTLFLNGTTDEEGVCCPVGGEGTIGPNIEFCDPQTVQLSFSATFVY